MIERMDACARDVVLGSHDDLLDTRDVLVQLALDGRTLGSANCVGSGVLEHLGELFLRQLEALVPHGGCGRKREARLSPSRTRSPEAGRQKIEIGPS